MTTTTDTEEPAVVMASSVTAPSLVGFSPAKKADKAVVEKPVDELEEDIPLTIPRWSEYCSR